MKHLTHDIIYKFTCANVNLFGNWVNTDDETHLLCSDLEDLVSFF